MPSPLFPGFIPPPPPEKSTKGKLALDPIVTLPNLAPPNTPSPSTIIQDNAMLSIEKLKKQRPANLTKLQAGRPILAYGLRASLETAVNAARRASSPQKTTTPEQIEAKSGNMRTVMKFQYIEPPNGKRPFETRLIAYGRQPSEEMADDEYKFEANQLYHQIAGFVEVFFCNNTTEKIKTGVKFNPWHIQHTAEFLRHAELVACSDPLTGGWNRLLEDPVQRRFLLIGIIAKILETKVFNELLFGASKHEIDMLEVIEKTLVRKEGFERTQLRAETTRTIMGTSPVTSNFDESVAQLTTRTLLLLEPLTLYVERIRNNGHSIDDSPTLDELVQALNDIFSKAAYLSITIRHSNTIFSIQSARPDEAFDESRHHCLDMAYFYESRANAGRAAVTAASSLLSSSTSNSARSKGGRKAESLQTLTKIAVFPSITRHKPGSGVEGGEKHGFRVSEIGQAGVLCYCTLTTSEVPQEARLKEWAATTYEANLPWWRRARMHRLALSIVVLLLVLQACCQAGGEDDGSSMVAKVKEAAMRWARELFVVEVPTRVEQEI